MNVQHEEADIHCWAWDYPMEKRCRVFLLSGDGPRRMRDIIESKFNVTYTRSMVNVAGRVEAFGKGADTVYVVMLISEWRNTNQQLAVLAHEVNHLVFSHFKDRGYHIPLAGHDGNDEELFNNQSEWWMYTMLEALNAPAEEKSEHLWSFNNETVIP